MRNILAILAVALATTAAQAQLTVHVTTNNFNDLNPARDALSANVGTIRIRHTINNGVIPLDLSQASGLALRIVDAQDGYTNNVPVVVVTNSPGVVFWEFALFNERTYRLRASATIPGDTFPVFDRFLTVTSTSAQASSVINITNRNEITLGSVTVGVEIAEGAITVDSSVVLTNIITIENNSYIQTTITSTGGTVGVQSDGTNYNLEVIGGGGGSISNVFGVYPVIVTNFADNFYIGLVSFDGIIIAPSFTNQAVVQFGGPTNYVFSVPLTVTQLVAHLWGGGGATTFSKAGGYTEVIFPVTGGEALTITVGEGGLVVPQTNATGASTARGGWPDGGIGIQRNNYSPSIASGAGSSRILRGTNVIAVAGGAGGFAASSTASGAGGGSSGGDGVGTISGIAGGGGTQTAGGTSGSTAVLMFVTNSAGSFLQGGNGGATTNLITGAAGGGGGGYFGGGGGLSVNVTASRGGGGAGSGYWNPALANYGTTIRGGNSEPALQESPYYGTDIGGYGWGTAQVPRGAHGGVVLRWKAE